MFESASTSDGAATTDAVRAEYWMILHERLVAGAKQRLALEAAEARDLVYAEEAEIWRRFGYMSMLEYMQRELFYEGSGFASPTSCSSCPYSPRHFARASCRSARSRS